LQVAKNERLASLVTLAAGAAHELGTPLGTIAVVAKDMERYAAETSSDGPLVDDAKLIRSEVERCRVILERMSVQGGEPWGESLRQIRIHELLNKIVNQFPEIQRKRISVEPARESMTAVLPEQATSQSIVALIQNALDANVGDRPVRLSARRNGSLLEIAVCDEGVGMPPEVVRRIAEPFFTTKEPGKGMGLGTFLVRTLAERLGGDLVFESTVGAGTTATLRLPANSRTEGTSSS
jgi:two-component system sensor histidine kinase RegB